MIIFRFVRWSVASTSARPRRSLAKVTSYKSTAPLSFSSDLRRAARSRRTSRAASSATDSMWSEMDRRIAVFNWGFRGDAAAPGV